MIARQGTWAEVEVGTYVKDAQDRTWRVDAERAGKVLLVRPDAQPVAMLRPPRSREVTLLAPTDDEALAIVQESLGAEVVAQQPTPGAPWQCPPLPHRLDMIHTHMFMLHGIWTKTGPGSKSKEKLLEMHREDHLADEPTSHAWVNHEHH